MARVSEGEPVIGESLPAARLQKVGDTWRVHAADEPGDYVDVVIRRTGGGRVAIHVEGSPMLDDQAVRGLVVALQSARARAWTDEERGA